MKAVNYSAVRSPLAELLAAAAAAEERYDHESAVAYYSAALDLPDLTLEEQYEILDGRAHAYFLWGHRPGHIADTGKLFAVARALGDKRKLAAALAVHGFLESFYDDQSTIEEAGRQALALATELGDDRLLAYAYLTLAGVDSERESEIAAQHLNSALTHARRSGDNEALYYTYLRLATERAFSNRTEEAQQFAALCRSLAQQVGNLVHKAYAFFISGFGETDLARKRNYYERAIAGSVTANNLLSTVSMSNSMSLLLSKLGLYRRSLTYAQESVASAQRLGMFVEMGNSLDAVGRAFLGQGLLDEAQQAFQHGRDLLAESPFYQSYLVYGLAQVALARGRHQKAIQLLNEAMRLDSSLGTVGCAALGNAYRLQGDNKQALENTMRAVSHLRDGEDITEYTTQEIWWSNFQALRAVGHEEEAVASLDQACSAMLAAIATLSDEGLRRNYLNKVAINREISLAWTAAAAKRGLPLDPFTAHVPPSGNLKDQFRRMVEIGARLSAQHDPDTLAAFIVEEFVEMSGAERVLLLVLDDDGSLQPAASFNPQDALDLAGPLLDSLSHERHALLLQDVGEAPDGEVPELHLRSLIALPLIAQGNLLGMLYGDMRQIFGRFDDADLHLLAMLANQAAAALENAELVSNLEAQVEDRTADLQRRVLELGIINNVSSGLAARLDFQKIVDSVGERLYEVFHADTTFIALIDEERGLIEFPYYNEHGFHHEVALAFGEGFTSVVIAENRPLHLNMREEQVKYGMVVMQSPGEEDDLNESILAVPILAGDRVIGAASVQRHAKYAYDENDLRLLQTLAANLGVALENARLFDETQQRSRELAIINSVQEGLAANLDLQAIFDVVGDKLSEIYEGDSISLATYDAVSDLAYTVYLQELGERLTLEPHKPGEIGRHALSTHQALLMRARSDYEEMGIETIEGTTPALSGMYMPLVLGENLVGHLSVESNTRENAYDDSDLRLLTTLANSMSVALENARLFDETQQRNNELAVINTVQEGLVAELSLEAIFEVVGKKLTEIYPEDSVALYSVDHQNGLAIPRFNLDRGERYYPEPFVPGPIGITIIEEMRPVMMASEADYEAVGAKIVGDTLPSYSGMYVPLISGDSVVGVVNIENSRDEYAYNENDLRLLTSLANSMSVALENARLFDETQRRAREMATLADVGRDISATLDLQDVLERIAGHALEMLDVSDSAVFLPDESKKHMRSVVALGAIAEQLKSAVIRPGSGIMGDVWQRRTPEMINDANADPRSIAIAGTPNRDDERMMVAPLLSADEVVGLMTVWRHGAPFTAADMQFLDGLARQAAIAIQNARLYSEAETAKLEAEKANATKSRFLANMSHELRTPLNAIIGFTRIIKRKTKDVAPEKQLDNMDKVLDSAEHLLGLINTILDIAKIEAGRMDVINSRFQVAPLIELCTMTTQPLLKPGVVFKQEISSDLPPLVSDQDKLKQILLNLLSNAAKFTHEGTVTVHVEIRPPADGDKQVPLLLIDVVDTGIGMDEEELSRVFEEFQQAGASTSRQYGGTGLGMPISKQLAQLLGGDLTAQSRPGAGTTFTLTLPWEPPSSEPDSESPVQ